MPSTEPIIALFDEAGQARRLRDELCRAGLSPDEMTLILPSPAAASARAEVVDRLIGAGIPKPDAPLFADEVCGGATLLAIRPAEAERARVTQIIGRHAPARRMAAAASGEPQSGDSSAEGAEVVPMPTGSGALGSRPVPSDDGDR
ncbi:MAG: hypothetical protein JO008_01500 [Alphaproteobacteria bacterium]|nr:hypothetical protein [Alphaproteobacteria bacterium]